MKYSLISPQGTIIKTEEFGKAKPPILAPVKGRWIPDVRPIGVKEDLQMISLVTPIPASAVTVPYKIVNRERPLLIKFIKSRINTWVKQNLASFSWNNHTWDMNELASAKINFYGLSRTAPACKYWTDAKNVDVPVTGEDMANMLAAMMAHQDTIHNKQRVAKKKLESLTDDQLVNLDVESLLNG